MCIMNAYQGVKQKEMYLEKGPEIFTSIFTLWPQVATQEGHTGH